MRTRASFLAALVLGALGVSGLACQRPATTTSHRVASLRERTIPPGAKLIDLTGPTEDDSGLKATWELETDMAWDAYTAWLAGQVSDDFEAEPGQESRLIWRQALPGDSLTLSFEPLSSQPPLRVLATFIGRPD